MTFWCDKMVLEFFYSGTNALY